MWNISALMFDLITSTFLEVGVGSFTAGKVVTICDTLAHAVIQSKSRCACFLTTVIFIALACCEIQNKTFTMAFHERACIDAFAILKIWSFAVFTFSNHAIRCHNTIAFIKVPLSILWAYFHIVAPLERNTCAGFKIRHLIMSTLEMKIAFFTNTVTYIH